MKRIVICLIAFLLGGSMMLAQLPTGVILGVVKDSSGAVIPGATVTALAVDTGQTRTLVTGGDGAYRFDGLPIGNYSITVEASGFQRTVQSGLTLTVGQQLVADVTLQVGQATQTVSVTTAAPLISTTTSTLSSLVNSQQVADLPLNGRNYTTLTLLQPGVTQTANGGTLTGFGAAGTTYSSNGMPITDNNYMLDGTVLGNAVDESGASPIGTTLGVDGIQEFRVVTSGEDAEYGLKMGSQTIVVSKSGTNQFHGDLFDFLRNSALDSRNDFDLKPSVLGRRLPEYRRNQFGGALGGPIQKDKTFFFGVYEGLRAYLGTTNVDTTLAPGCQGGPGAVITLAECPQLSPVASATIVPQMAPFVALYPSPNLPDNDYGFVFPQVTYENYAQLRLDHTISAKDNIFGRWTFDTAKEPAPYQFDESDVIDSGRDQFITLAENHIFSPTLLNSARVSYSKAPVSVTIGVINPLIATAPYITAAGGPENLMGGLAIGGLTAIGPCKGCPRLGNQTTLALSDDVSYTRGRHSLKFGFVWNYVQDHTVILGYDKDSITFGDVADFMTAFTAELSGIPPGTDFNRFLLWQEMGFYGQDAWRLTPRLTLNLGMRYEPMTGMHDANGLSSSFRNPATDTGFTVGPYFTSPAMRDWGPRAGFAWDIFGNGSTSLRGGFGVLYDQSSFGPGAVVNNAGVGPPFVNQYTDTNFTLTVPFPAPTPGTQAVVGSFLQWKIAMPHALVYNLTAERRLPGNMGLTVAYSGSRGINLQQNIEGNPTAPTGIPLANGGTECIPAPAGTVQNLNTLITSTQYSEEDGTANACYLLTSPRENPTTAPFGLKIGSTPMFLDGGDSRYDALQMAVNKSLSKGLQFQGAYTLGRVIDDVPGEDLEDNHNRSRRGSADFDVRHVLHINTIYHLPAFTDSKGFAGKAVNGWWLSGIWSPQTALDLYTSETGFRDQAYAKSTFGGSDSVPDVVPGRNNSNTTHGTSIGCGTGPSRAAGGTEIPAGTPLHTKALWFDPCAFSVQPAGFIGNEPRNFLRGPGYDDLDASIVKDTAVGFLGEGGQVEFRGEFFNLPNHPNFDNPTNAETGATCGGSVLACSANQANPGASAGIVTATNGTSRQIQFGLKLVF